MNETREKVILAASREMLAASTSTGSQLVLDYVPRAPCRLASLVVYPSQWRLARIVSNNRYQLWSPHAWGGGLVLFPGHRLDVTIENDGWDESMVVPEVVMELERLIKPRPLATWPRGLLAPAPEPEPEPPSPLPTRFSELDLADEDE